MPSKLDCALHAWCFRDDFHLKTFSLVTPVFSLGILKQWLNKDCFSHYINKSRWAASVSAGQATALLMGSKGQRWLGWIAQSGLGSYSISHSSIMKLKWFISNWSCLCPGCDTYYDVFSEKGLVWCWHHQHQSARWTKLKCTVDHFDNWN